MKRIGINAGPVAPILSKNYFRSIFEPIGVSIETYRADDGLCESSYDIDLVIVEDDQTSAAVDRINKLSRYAAKLIE